MQQSRAGANGLLDVAHAPKGLLHCSEKLINVLFFCFLFFSKTDDIFVETDPAD